MSFKNILKKLRQDNQLTQEELAKKVDTSRSNIANYENGKNLPSIEMLNKLSKTLNCTVDYLIGKSDIKNESSQIFGFDKKQILEALEIARTTTTSLKNNTIIIDVTGLTDDDIEDIKELARSKRERRKKN